MKKINSLPKEKLDEVEDFIDFLQAKLKCQAKESRLQTISEYAEKHAGSDVDFGEELERTGVKN